MFNDDVPVSFNKMDGFSTVDGFVEITESMADMINYLANEPSVGLFYIQQHTQNSVPNLVNLRNNVDQKSRELALHSEDLEDSITMVSSMKECGFPIIDDMIKDIKKSLVIMSTKEPKRGLINNSSNNPSSRFQMGRTSSWGPSTWGDRKADLQRQDGENNTRSYFTTVFKSAKEKANILKWPQFDFSELKREEVDRGARPFVAASASSTMSTSMEVEELPHSCQIANELLRKEESQVDGSLNGDQLMPFSENFDAFRAEKEAKLEEWLKGTSNQET